EEHEIHPLVAEALERLLAVARLHHAVPVALERIGQQLLDRLLVVHQEDRGAWGHAHRIGRARVRLVTIRLCSVYHPVSCPRPASIAAGVPHARLPLMLGGVEPALSTAPSPCGSTEPPGPRLPFRSSSWPSRSPSRARFRRRASRQPSTRTPRSDSRPTSPGTTRTACPGRRAPTR